MENKTKEELIKDGLHFLVSALTHIVEIKDCEKSNGLCGMIKGAILLGESIYEDTKK